MPHKDIPNMLGRVLSGTKYGVKQTRGVWLGVVRWVRCGATHLVCATRRTSSSSYTHPFLVPYPTHTISRPLCFPHLLPLCSSMTPTPHQHRQVRSGRQDGPHLVQDDHRPALRDQLRHAARRTALPLPPGHRHTQVSPRQAVSGGVEERAGARIKEGGSGGGQGQRKGELLGRDAPAVAMEGARRRYPLPQAP